MKRLSHIAAIAVLLLLLGIGTLSCNNENCNGNGSSLPLATFYVGNNQQTISGLTVMGIGVPGDSLLLDSASAKELYLPLRASATSSSFMLRRWKIANTVATPITDTLSIGYQSIEYFHSIDCGAMYNFNVENLTYTTHGIDSVVLVTKLITNSRTPALRIYFAQ